LFLTAGATIVGLSKPSLETTVHKDENGMRLKTAPVRPLFFLIVFALCASTVAAQSGRRTAKAIPAATPSPEPTPAEKAKPKEKSNLVISVGLERNTFSTATFGYTGIVLYGCADRLKKSAATVDVSSQNVNRGEAVKRAKASKDAFVVLLKIGPDAGGVEGTYGNQNLSDFYVEYVVFSPTTAKVAASGRAYLGSVRKGGVSVPINPGRSSVMYAEQLLRQAAEDAAERILNALHVFDLPQGRP
jgi:hypothetical protein